MNTFGHLFRFSSFGESHGPAIGGIIDGCPSGVNISVDRLQEALSLRRPGCSPLSSSRKEEDQVKILSGVFNGKSTGAPIAFIIENKDARSEDYKDLEQVFRPSHADYTYFAKWGVRDHRGGGRSSARETACRVVAGAIATELLGHYGIEIAAYTCSVGNVCMSPLYWDDVRREEIYANPVRCPDARKVEAMSMSIDSAKRDNDSIGGSIACIARGIPAGWGSPLYDKLSGALASAMLSINACKGFEIGDGFEGCTKRGSEQNDFFVPSNDGKGLRTTSNHSGGIQGGLSNGACLRFRVGFKPVSSIAQEQASVNNKFEAVKLAVKGRHDACVLPRAVPIVEAMTALVLADACLMSRSDRIDSIKPRTENGIEPA